jgi:hypothetical protein
MKAQRNESSWESCTTNGKKMKFMQFRQGNGMVDETPLSNYPRFKFVDFVPIVQLSQLSQLARFLFIVELSKSLKTF